jgi:hypothetical protein
MRARVEAKAGEIREVFSGAPAEARRMLLMLLDQDRLCVHSDDERGFRIEGGFYIPLEERTPGEDDLPGRSEAMVAGEGFASSLRLRRLRDA